MEETTYKWTVDKTKQLISLRVQHDSLFTKKRNAVKQAWDFVIKEMGLQDNISHKQASKKWENLKKRYKELRKPPTGSGTDKGEETPSTWPYYLAMHEALGSRPSISPPVLVASCLPGPTILPPSPAESSPAPSCSTSPTDPSTNSPSLINCSSPGPSRPNPSPEPALPPAPKRRRRDTSVLDFLKKESEKEDKRHEELSKQTERLVSAFEKMVEKM